MGVVAGGAHFLARKRGGIGRGERGLGVNGVRYVKGRRVEGAAVVYRHVHFSSSTGAVVAVFFMSYAPFSVGAIVVVFCSIHTMFIAVARLL